MTVTDFDFPVCFDTVPGTSTYTIRGFRKSVTERLRSNYVPTHKTPSITSGVESNFRQLIPENFNNSETENPRSRKSYPVYPSMPYGALPETTLRNSTLSFMGTIRSTYKLLLIFSAHSLRTYSNTTQLCKITTAYIQETNYCQY